MEQKSEVKFWIVHGHKGMTHDNDEEQLTTLSINCLKASPGMVCDIAEL